MRRKYKPVTINQAIAIKRVMTIIFILSSTASIFNGYLITKTEINNQNKYKTTEATIIEVKENILKRITQSKRRLSIIQLVCLIQ